jgi:hypothetical protein
VQNVHQFKNWNGFYFQEMLADPIPSAGATLFKFALRYFYGILYRAGGVSHRTKRLGPQLNMFCGLIRSPGEMDFVFHWIKIERGRHNG